jgi:hypothetical protein
MDLFLAERPKLVLWSDIRGDWGRGQIAPRLYVEQDAGSDVLSGQLKMKTYISCSVTQQLKVVLKSFLV